MRERKRTRSTTRRRTADMTGSGKKPEVSEGVSACRLPHNLKRGTCFQEAALFHFKRD